MKPSSIGGVAAFAATLALNLSCLCHAGPPPGADLSVVVSDTPDPARFGDEVEYAIVVENHGPLEAANVAFEIHPPRSGVLGYEIPGQAVCDENLLQNGILSCEIAALPNGASFEVRFTAQVDGIAIASATEGALHLTASARSLTPDPNLTDNHRVEATELLAADLAVEITIAPEVAFASEEFSYTVRVTNAGPSTAEVVRLRIENASSTAVVDADPGWFCLPPDEFGLRCTYPTLEKGMTKEVRVIERVSSDTVGQSVRKVSAFSNIPDPFLSNNTDLGIVQVIRNLSHTMSQAVSARVAAVGPHVYALWQETPPGAMAGHDDIFFTASHDRGTTFSPPVNLSLTPDTSRAPTIAAEGDNVFVAWHEEIPNSRSEVRYRISRDGGTSFETAQPAETDPEKSSIYPEFAVAGERVYLLWESNGIFMRSSADSGANFGPTATILDEFPGAIGFSKIAAWGPDVYILWPDDRANTAQDYDILLRASHDFGGSFGAEIKLTETAGTTTIPVVKLAATRDKVFAAWHDDGLGTLMRVGEDHGSAFAPHLNLSTFAGSLVGAIQARGEEFFIAWSSFAGGSGVSEIHFARSSDAGMTFEAPQKLAQDRPNVTALELATGGGTVHLTWSDTFEGPANVYLWRTDIPQPVRFVYLIPTDKVFQPCYEQAIRESALNLQRWYQDQMGNGRTFSLHDPIVEAYGTPHDATYYATHDIGVGATHAFYYNARQDGFDLTGGVSDDPDYCWVFYIDADPACGQTGGAALPSSAVLPANDLRGLTGQAVLPKCPEEVPEDTGPCRWVGGLGHELGHALGLPHPPGCDEELPECDIDALMAGGFRDYPSTFLRAEEIDQLNLSPFISTLDLDGEVPDCAIVAQGCLASDLSIRLKPIQAVPDPATLVEGKRTLLRVEVFSSFQSDLEVNIHLVFDTASGQGDVSARAVAHPGKNAYLLPDNQFILPPGDNFSAFAEVSPVDNQVLDLVEGNNDFSLIVPIVKTRPFGVLYVPVKLSNDTIPPPSPPEMLSFRKGSSEYLEGAFPISFVDFMDQVSVVPYVPQGLLGPLDGQGVNKLFKQLDKMAWWDQYSKVVGVFGLGWHASATPHNAVGLALTSRGWDGVFVEKQYVNGVVTAQEIAHTFTWARDHPFNQALDCSAPGVDCYHMVDYPADGYWVSKRMEISATDFMHPSAGSTTQVDRWISGETFDFLLNELRLPPGKDIKQAEPLAVIGISATIHKSGSVELDPWYRLLGTPDLQLGGNGEYGVRYLDSNGATLGEAAFDLNFEDYSHEHRGELESAPFSLKVPDLPGASELALTHMGEVLVSVPISTHPPEVAVLSPNGGEVYLSGENLPIQWSSSDTDGGERCHVVSFSLDGGANWLPAAVDLIGQTLTLPVMPGMETEQGLIRVIVTDGVNTSMDTSDAGFSIRLSECPEGNDPCRLLELLSRVKSGQAVGEDLLEWCLTWH
ncbi:MAG: hypothetical protein GHCLOJNM_03094 [bacterium]|nr:hypothetical protein [bacterium]